jgi:chromate transporter
VVGVILNLAVWFALHTVFEIVEETEAWGVRLLMPHWQTIDITALLLAAGAFVTIFRFRWGMLPTLGASVALGFAWRMLGAH